MLQATPFFYDMLYQRKVHFEGMKLYSTFGNRNFVSAEAVERIGHIWLTNAFSGRELLFSWDKKHNSKKNLVAYSDIFSFFENKL